MRCRIIPLRNVDERDEHVSEAAGHQEEKPVLSVSVREHVRALLRPAVKAAAAFALSKVLQVTTEENLLSFSTPSAADLIANHLRGFVLFGRPSMVGADFKWCRFPMRAVITTDTAAIPKRLRPLHRRATLEARYSQDVEEVVRYCQDGRSGWLTPGLVEVYRELDKLGFLCTLGMYRDDQLVAGVLGIAVGRVYTVMSMFHHEDNAGALAMAALVADVSTGGRWSVIDCGSLNLNFARYGAHEVPTAELVGMMLQGIAPAR
jgi:leucyl/phenylalanyl-tRNA---protein transferase